MSLSPQLRDAAFRWIVDDFDDDSKQELQMVVGSAMAGNDDAVAELSDRMNGSLTFGTAGLRGIVRAGPNGMNRAVVARTTFAVASWLTANGHGGGIVIVGRDARHGSEVFATDVAEVLAALGFDVRAFADPLPTPLVPFAVRQLSAVAGIQITASHNPPADNGYKLYDNSGAQIIAPADREIEAAIRQAPAARNIGRTRGWREIDESVVDDYLSRIGKIHTGESRKLRIALTPMHGVGGEIAVKALRVAGFTDVHVVREQAAPDPEFPTVSFPNPEEPGATDLLLALAGKVGADLAIALDPDADRCAIGIPTGDGWRMLRGDETGALLGDYLLSTLDTSAHPDPLVATTIVSSTMLKSIAAKHGARYAETLTGFKWLVRAGDGLVFAYEEALGNCVDPNSVRDKDGISAAVLAADLAGTRKAAGSSLAAALDELDVEYGVHATGQIALRFEQLSEIDRKMAKLRADPPDYIAGEPFEFHDLSPDADVLRLTGVGARIVVRPSGTEPKLKAYLEVVESPTADVADARARAQDRLAIFDTALRELLTNL